MAFVDAARQSLIGVPNQRRHHRVGLPVKLAVTLNALKKPQVSSAPCHHPDGVCQLQTGSSLEVVMSGLLRMAKNSHALEGALNGAYAVEHRRHSERTSQVGPETEHGAARGDGSSFSS